ncbi:MAG: hypothetical protein LIO96_14560, partial [Lachnospiraceae bacterium]|nr:hypothetical protein [Lachnospiraceae bacterium]
LAKSVTFILKIYGLFPSLSSSQSPGAFLFFHPHNIQAISASFILTISGRFQPSLLQQVPESFYIPLKTAPRTQPDFFTSENFSASHEQSVFSAIRFL